MADGYMILNGKKYKMECSYIELNGRKGIHETMRAIRDRNRFMKDLENRSRELRTQADQLRGKDPVKAKLLEHRGIVLADEAYRIKKENKHGMTSDQIRRSAVLAWLALEKDQVVKK